MSSQIILEQGTGIHFDCNGLNPGLNTLVLQRDLTAGESLKLNFGEGLSVNITSSTPVGKNHQARKIFRQDGDITFRHTPNNADYTLIIKQ